MHEPITCPWCGTNYAAFRSNCKNCGGPLPPPRPQAQPAGFSFSLDTAPPELPPPAPRHISDSYALRLLAADGCAIASVIFVILGGTFACTGIPMVFTLVTIFVGIPFALLGLAFLA